MNQNSFPTELTKILGRLEAFDPRTYARTRNFVDGHVSRLSPYISRGVISTRFVVRSLKERGINLKSIEKFVQELAWRDYWQNRMILREETSFSGDPRQGARSGVPTALVEANTGIDAVDDALTEMYETGYMHNHVRMYTAAIGVNFGGCDWKACADWMYYHLIDGDPASNHYSWQWVAGVGRGKHYIANQTNINKYCNTNQTGTFLDKTYEELEFMELPSQLAETTEACQVTILPKTERPQIDEKKPTLVYNYFNIDPFWRNDMEANRILLLEPSLFKQYPVSPLCLEFAIGLSENINGLQVFSGNFEDLLEVSGGSEIFFKEHPLNIGYKGTEDERDWIRRTEKDHRSFFGFWKEIEKSGALECI